MQPTEKPLEWFQTNQGQIVNFIGLSFFSSSRIYAVSICLIIQVTKFCWEGLMLDMKKFSRIILKFIEVSKALLHENVTFY